MNIPEAAMLTNEQQARLQEVADLMLTIYNTLSEMRYLQPAGIIKGAHDITTIRTTYTKHNLSPEIIYLYSILPYIDTDLADAGDFFQGGEFFNHMDVRDVAQGRDPCYSSPKGGFDEENGEYMYPWYTPLSGCGNHSSLIVYDAREHRIWVVDQIQRTSTDPFFCAAWYGPVVKEESNWGDSEESSWGEEEGNDDEIIGSEGSSELWEDEDELEESEIEGLKADQDEEVAFDEGFDIVEEMSDWDRRQALNLKNQNSLELTRSRDACDVLRDIIQYYRELKEIPGQGEHTGGIWNHTKLVRSLYLKHGWPDEFNGEGFDIDLIRGNSAKQAKYGAEQPMRQLQHLESGIPALAREIEEHQRKVEGTTDVNSEWTARFELFQAQEWQRRNERDLQKARAKVERQYGDGKAQREEDLPLWECEQLWVDLQHTKERIQRQDNWRDAYGDDQRSIRVLEIQHQHHLRKLALHEKAFAASKADAERLCGGRTFEDATGIKSLGRPDTLTNIKRSKDCLDYSRQYLQRIKDFVIQVPAVATETTKVVQAHVKKWENDLVNMEDRVQKYEQQLILEQGNTD